MNILNDFRNLNDEPTDKICNTFNLAFSDYVVPFHLTNAVLEEKMKLENLQRHYSIGAFNGNELAGFILQGPDDNHHPKVLYNGGTGVIPGFRGQQLVRKMYDAFIPSYQEKGIRTLKLEVIVANTTAVKTYEKTGFEKKRFFQCFKGDITLNRPLNAIEIVQQPEPNWALYSLFMDMEPSWSNLPGSIQREVTTVTWEAHINGEVAGFISVNTPTKRIRNLAVARKYRRQGVASALLQHVATTLEGTFTIINIEENVEGMAAFLEKAGMTNYLNQYEMTLSI
ncbi:ribosomal protein S18 acetylase RimI-like enzyme [Chitinophaga dinghuensis]|uniref:Ribosomal protein S18 acetylase RimI-like enzyme n=1 Tax=Chitinophaga dinghuensis TaxID=1539050 RepID=A0A327VJ94_9BACT|nr:GNAT family N-acetyltransferase [Chitinophaga dinghuensis]RAJ73924.1 ribosomal protein S18 acetylase RimI-like enzyme [Chitinophaga dinghuensis]